MDKMKEEIDLQLGSIPPIELARGNFKTEFTKEVGATWINSFNNDQVLIDGWNEFCE